MYYKEMNSISFKASVQIIYIVLCNYCTTCIIYRDKLKFKVTSRYLDDLLNIDNHYFEQMVGQIYPTELHSSDTEAPFLDLNLSIT